MEVSTQQLPSDSVVRIHLFFALQDRHHKCYFVQLNQKAQYLIVSRDPTCYLNFLARQRKIVIFCRVQYNMQYLNTFVLD